MQLREKIQCIQIYTQMEKLDDEVSHSNIHFRPQYFVGNENRNPHKTIIGKVTINEGEYGYIQVSSSTWWSVVGIQTCLYVHPS